jgi:hypothetical protein
MGNALVYGFLLARTKGFEQPAWWDRLSELIVRASFHCHVNIQTILSLRQVEIGRLNETVPIICVHLLHPSIQPPAIHPVRNLCVDQSATTYLPS